MFVRFAWFLCGAVVAALLLIPYAAHGAPGDRTAGGPPNDYIVISARLCESTIKNHVKPEFLPILKHAVYHMRNGVKIPGCWLTIPETPGMVLMVFEDGDYLEVPDDQFFPRKNGANHRPGYRPDARSWDASLVIGTRG